MSPRVLNVGAIGLGRAFSLALPTFILDDRVRLMAAFDPRPEARDQFSRDFGRAYADAQALCADPDVDVVYVASPHELHAEHAILAANAGKHVLVEKPMAVRLEDCSAMIAAAESNGVHLIVGPSHSFNKPIQRAREIIRSGELGAVRMITTMNYTDFLYRPRRPEELATDRGGGVLFSQGAHQVDIVRLVGGGDVQTVRGAVGRWDPQRPTEGAYAGLLVFANGAFASVVYSGYGHFDSDEFCGWIGESGGPKDPTRYGDARRALTRIATAEDETLLKLQRTYPATSSRGNHDHSVEPHHQHFGPLIISCENGDIRPTPDGISIYGNSERRQERFEPVSIPRKELIDEVYDAVVNGISPIHDGRWSMATLEVCLAILQSAHEGRDVPLRHQTPLPL